MKTLATVVTLFLMTAIMPASVRADVGADIEAQYGIVHDAKLNARLDRVAARVQMAISQKYPKCARLHFKILNDPDLNACALPDGRIYVTSGMMAAATTDDQLAFVIGHEATHVGQKHSRHQIGGTIIGAILGVGVSLATGGNTEDAIKTGAVIGGGLIGSSYSRDDEYRADAGGVELLLLEGYNPTAGAQSLQMLQDRYGRGAAGTPIIGWFASHPDTKNRVARCQKLAASLSPQNGVPTVMSGPATVATVQLPRVAVIVKDEYNGGWNGFWGNQSPERVAKDVMEASLEEEGFVVVDKENRQETWDEQDTAKTGRMEPGTVAPTGHTYGAEFFLYLSINYYQVTQTGEIQVGSWQNNGRLRLTTAEFKGVAKLEPVAQSIVATTVRFDHRENGYETEVTFNRWTSGVDIAWESHPAGLAVDRACQQVASALAAKFQPIIQPQFVPTPAVPSPVSPGTVTNIIGPLAVKTPPVNLDQVAIVTLCIKSKDGRGSQDRQIEVKLAELMLADYLIWSRDGMAMARVNLTSQVNFNPAPDHRRWEMSGVLYAPSWSDFTKPGYMDGITEIKLFKKK